MKDDIAQREIVNALAKIGKPALEFLILALNDKDLVKDGAYLFFIYRGESRFEPFLIDALNKYGYEKMAKDFFKLRK